MNKIFAAVFGLLFFIFNSCAAYSAEGSIRITMLDVGQGDSFLVETPEQNILIDSGTVNSRSALIAQINDAGVTRFERIILTHPHSDHIGGIQAVLDNFPVDLICDNGRVSRSPLFKQYRLADTNFSTFKQGDILDFGGGAFFQVLNPPLFPFYKNPNDFSIVGKLTFGDFSMLFTGDATQTVEEDLLAFNLNSTILQVPHHGSKSSATENFIANVQPQAVFISAGFNNSFGHPHKKTLDTLRFQGISPENIFCTAFNGSVRVDSDGSTFSITPAVPDDWLERYTGDRIVITHLD